MELFEKRYNHLRSTFELNWHCFKRVSIALEEIARYTEDAAIKKVALGAVANLKDATSQVARATGHE